MNLIIENVRIIDSNKSEYGNIVIKNGFITNVKNIKDLNGFKTIDGKGLTAMPAFVDTHAHFREPGFESKETIETGSRAAIKGGYTTVLLMGNTNPPCSSINVIQGIQDKARNIGLVDIIQCGNITKDIQCNSIDHLYEICKVTKFITDDGKGVMNDKLMMEAMIFAENNNLTVVSHAENHYFSDTDMRLAENMMTFRDIELCRITNCKLHMAHVSTKEAVARIIQGKEEGLNLTFEVTPHHIFSDKTVKYRVNPPLREKEDIKSIIEAIKNDYVDSIGTDHAPHTSVDKANGSPGISGIETSFSICYTVLVKDNHVSLNQLSSIMSEKPSKLLGFNKGLIEEGYEGDIVLVDTELKHVIDSSKFLSKGKNTPFDGREVFGKVLVTIKKGIIVYRGEEYDCR